MSALSSGKRQLLLGMGIFTLAVSVHAASGPQIESSMPETAMIDGSRLFAGETGKNEFFILTQNQPDPIKKGPVFVNTQPIEAGIDSANMLSSKQPEEEDEYQQSIQEILGEEEEQPQTATVAADAPSEQRYFDAAVPVDDRFDAASSIIMQS